MSRMKVIVVVMMPVLLLLVSADFYGDPSTHCRCVNLRRLLSAGGSNKHSSSSADNLFDQAVHRASRRSNLEPRTDGFASTVTPTQTQLPQPEQSSLSLVLPNVSFELAQSWQFLWRTALEPRAPSFVS